ncbi:MAG: type II toxin-antitoxin system prevent-host-death family antitoxin [Actinomycetota bacterium]|nr:type II toxin-antitoxin system prevent-host-death family antitoxin [Actinomycetota bacterium]
MIVNMHEAKTQLSRLVEKAAAGEDIIIGRSGRPVARLVPYVEAPKARVPGRLRGRIQIADDFDDPDEEIADLFEGERT